MAAAVKGPVIGGSFYILFAFVPMFLVTSALIIMPAEATALLKEDPQKILPTLVLQHMPFFMQVLFFGALISAVMSTASATLLAPSVTFTENIWRNFRPRTSDRQELRTMRITVLILAGCVLAYSIRMEGTPIYELVSGAYQVPLVGAFVPLVCGLYWKRATTQGAIAAIGFGIGVWLVVMNTPAGAVFPAQLAGVLAAALAMVAGSLGPQLIANSSAPRREFVAAT